MSAQTPVVAIDEVALEEEFAKTTLKRATLGRLLGYVRPHKWPILAALAMEVVWVLSMLVDPRLIRVAVDDHLRTGDPAGAVPLAVWIAVNVMFRAVLTAIELRISTQVGVLVLHDIRSDVFNHVQRLSMRYFDRTKQGRIIARADRDVDTLEHLVLWGPIILVSLTFSMSLGFAVMLSSHATLSLWLLPAAPVLLVLTRVFHHFGFRAYRKVRETHARISAHVAECITGVRVVKAFAAEPREQDKLDALNDDYRGAVVHGARIAGAYVPSLTGVYHVLTLAVLAIGGHLAMGGSLEVGALIEFVLLLGLVYGPVEGLGGLYNESLIAGAAAERIFLLLDTEPEVRDRPGARDPGRLRGEVEFDDVCFAYDPERRHGWQLENVSFRVAPGETVALVGPTGAGKTSIVNLVARFYEAQEGEVRLDGTDIRDLQLTPLHRQMGMVLQESFLFAGTVYENLRFVVPDLTRDQAERGFTELGCREVLEGLTDGLDTEVGERGANLSEGERQITCFVRALLADPTILILDEATSAVDTRTEALILQAMRTLAARQTTLVIAHRLSTIKSADRILVIQDGGIAEQGTHRELLARNGAYADLYREYGI